MQAGHVAPCHVTIGPSPSSRTAAKGEISRERRRLPAHVTVTMDLASAGRCDGCRHRIIVAFRSPTQAGTHSTERKSSRAPQSPPLDRAAVAGPPKRRGALRPVPSSPARRARGPGTPVTATGTCGRGCGGGVPCLPRRVGRGAQKRARIRGTKDSWGTSPVPVARVRPAGLGGSAALHGTWEPSDTSCTAWRRGPYTPVICPNYGMWVRFDVRIMMIGKVAAQPLTSLRHMLYPTNLR
jgi:hypothetical protein